MTKTEVKHTLGPWQVSKLGPAVNYQIDAGEQMIAKTFAYLGEDEQLANARLISSSPDLLAALQVAIACLDEASSDTKYDNAKSMARAAIQKATNV